MHSRESMPRGKSIHAPWKRAGSSRAGILAGLLIGLGIPLSLTADDTFRVKDEVEVISVAARMKVGDETVARPAKGTTARVLAVQGDWLWTSIRVDGEDVQGWLHTRYVRLRTAPVPQSPPAPLPRPDAPPLPEATLDARMPASLAARAKITPKATTPAMKRDTPTTTKPEPATTSKDIAIAQRLRKAGAQVELNERQQIVRIDLEGRPAPPDLPRILPELNHLERVSFAFCPGIGDEHVAALKNCKGLVAADFMLCSEVSDDSLPVLGTLTHLESLNLSGTSVTDQGIGSLRRLIRLRHLELAGTPGARMSITDTVTGHLARFSRLQRLNLNSTDLTDRGLARLTRLADLRELDLGDTLVTNVGLGQLKKFEHLERLNLGFCSGLTEEGLHELAELPLKHLDLTFMPLSTIGVVHLCAIDTLETLTAIETGLTDDLASLVQTRLPECQIKLR
ncbi:MAG: hypothetical protein ACF8PG_15020 [Maioricimonas sp. JB045]